MSHLKVLLSASIAVLVVVLALSPSSADDEQADGVVVHEWGTFTSVSGSDGQPLYFHTALNDLPNFVSSAKMYDRKEWMYVRTSMETPVVYFYTKKAATVSVKVDFIGGAITDWYPAAKVERQSEKIKHGSIAWDKVELNPTEATDFPIDSERPGSHYYAARETDAVPLKLPGAKVHEKFLFYRGAGWFTQPLSLEARVGDKFVVRNTTDRQAAAAFILQKTEQGLRFQSLGAIKDKETSVQLSKDTVTIENAGNQLVKALVAAGLFEKEARAMVKTWTDTWLEETGTRLLYLLPPKTVEEWLPIQIKPAPAKLERAMIGRVDVLTPEFEREIDAHLKRARDKSAPEAQRNAEVETMRKRMGRFYDAAVDGADQRAANAKK